MKANSLIKLGVEFKQQIHNINSYKLLLLLILLDALLLLMFSIFHNNPELIVLWPTISVASQIDRRTSNVWMFARANSRACHSL